MSLAWASFNPWKMPLENRHDYISYFFECTLKATLTANIAALCPAQPKWHQNLWFTTIKKASKYTYKIQKPSTCCAPLLRVVKGIFVIRDRPFYFPMKCEMAIFSAWIVISVVAVKCDFAKLFSVNRDFHKSFFYFWQPLFFYLFIFFI